MQKPNGMTIFFNDSTSISFEFPYQGFEPGRMSNRLETLLKHDMLMLEVDGTLMTFPIGSIKYIQVWPAPTVLPSNVIKAAALTPAI